MIVNRTIFRLVSDPVLSLSNLGAVELFLASFLATCHSSGRIITAIVRGRTTTVASGLVATVPVSSECGNSTCVELLDINAVDMVRSDGIDVIFVACLDA